MTSHILLIEDDEAIAAVVAIGLQDRGFVVDHCVSIAQRDAKLAERSYGAMITDISLADGDGLADLETVRADKPNMPIIVISAQNTLDTAIRASDAKAYEYFPKPFDLDKLVDAVAQATRQTGRSDDAGSDAPNDLVTGLPLIGRSDAMQQVYRLITRVLQNDLTVLITGESGTGKELVAEAIHQNGARKTGPFVAINCAAIPHDLIESELFGHERGAFTGAIAQAIGKFEQANGGTLFLDEIGDMPADAQTRLLRALQSGQIRRVGGRKDILVNARIIAATNRNLAPLMADGRFREDLYYRLNVIPIALPPLRERREDIAELVQHFLHEAVAEGLPQRTVSTDAVTVLERREWPGNVRELRNLVFRLVALAREDTITASTLTEFEGASTAHSDLHTPKLGTALSQWIEAQSSLDGRLYHEALAAFEQPLFAHVLRQTGGNQIRSARMLGINRNTLRKKLSELGLRPEDFVQRP